MSLVEKIDFICAGWSTSNRMVNTFCWMELEVDGVNFGACFVLSFTVQRIHKANQSNVDHRSEIDIKNNDRGK